MATRTLTGILLLVLGLFGTNRPLHGDVALPAVFGDHMVLQRDLPVPVWGTAAPGESVTVSFAGQTVSTTAGADGRWRIELEPLAASAEPGRLVVAGRNRVEIEDVLVGEVWICGGQSNMEWSVNQSSDPAKERAQADRPTIRLIDAPRTTANRPRSDIDAQWTVCSPDTVGRFSAVGFAFARHLQDELDVPVGLLSINWGGTRIEPWISGETLLESSLSRERMTRQLAAVEAFEALTEGERFDREERIRLERDRATATYIDAQLAVDPGIPAGCFRTAFDDSGWNTVDLPRNWTDTATSLRNFDGGVWYRRTIDVPEDWAGRTLSLGLGAIDDSDVVWFDGVRIGSTVENHAQRRRYRVPGPLVKPGSRTIAVLVIDSGGEGGFGGPASAMRIGVMDRRAADPASLSLAGAWKWQRGQGHQGGRPAMPGPAAEEPGRRPTDHAALNHGMIQPFVPYAVRGAIWYQGESNSGEPARYAEFLPLLIADWGEDFERPDLPFGIVQLAAFRPFEADQPVSGTWPAMREAQSATAAILPNAGVVVLTDIGDAADIHPRNKREVGRRLARWALNDHYDRPNRDHASPRISACRRLPRSNDQKADRIRLTVVDPSGGLRTRDGAAPGGFALQGPSGRWHWADAVIDPNGSSITVWSDRIPNPVAVAYAWQDNPERANITGATGLPLDQFRGTCEQP